MRESPRYNLFSPCGELPRETWMKWHSLFWLIRTERRALAARAAARVRLNAFVGRVIPNHEPSVTNHQMVKRRYLRHLSGTFSFSGTIWAKHAGEPSGMSSSISILTPIMRTHCRSHLLVAMHIFMSSPFI